MKGDSSFLGYGSLPNGRLLFCTHTNFSRKRDYRPVWRNNKKTGSIDSRGDPNGIRHIICPILGKYWEQLQSRDETGEYRINHFSERDAYKLMLKDYPDVMSIEQMCEILGINTKTGYRILREGKICCLKVGRTYRIPKAHLFTFLCIGCGEEVTA